ncbi:hypothetical protein BU14_0103s0009 [Porphyra umbilicalis]|uniref:Glutathione peroxidase n=1 Tax=Porphyra umbilicalis TaxID=2786 RepID=A0A1X6PD54_PORUM|nr:hypothetical protein BU14_0103s0009 [Porphyra umbilicalis]|eukprot:OSX78666.1 hypothetical protein BU14_0103s0009 [Porphyra umbilicalis]
MGAFVAAPLGLLACSSGGLGPGPVRLSRRRQTGATVPPRTGRVAAARPAVLPSMVASGPDGDFSRRAFVAAAAASAAAAALSDLPVTATAATAAAPSTFFDLTATRGGEPTPLRDLFDDKVTLVVNVATYCALTPQYEGLVALHRTFAAGGEGKAGFDIAAFPCNQFGGQEPGTYQEICKFAQEKFGATFTLFDPINVNGPQTHPVYQWLKANNPEDSKRIEWNFAKFLVDRHGNVVRRYKPGVLPEMIAGDISALVADRPLPKKKRPQLGVE